MLKIHGVLAMLALEPSTGGWGAKAVQQVTRVVCVLGAAALLTLGIATLTRALLDKEAAAMSVEAMIASAVEPATSGDPAMRTIAAELRGEMHLALVQGEGGNSLAVAAAVGNAPGQGPDVCADTSPGIHPGAACLMRIRPAFGNATPEVLSGLLVKIEFPTTAYVLGPLVIEAALARDPDMELTQRRRTKVLEAIEAVMGERPFTPSSPEIVWARRLNGPIQLVTYFLACTALVMIAIGWANSVATNWAIRSIQTVPIRTREENAPQPARDQDGEEGESAPTTMLDDLPTPWSKDFVKRCPIDLGDAKATNEYYEEVSAAIRNESTVLGVQIDPPVLRLRCAAARAVANTNDTSMVPTFLETQREAIAALYDARMSLVRFLLWVIPTVGFVGTVLGVSAALGATVAVQSSRELVSALAQSAVSASMGIAFDTTLVALIAAIAVMLAQHWAQGAEDRMTVLERSRAEEEATGASRAIRKSGSTADIARQLVSLGVNSERLTRELRILQQSGPQLEAVIAEIKARNAELDAIDKNRRSETRRSSKTKTAVLAVAICLGLATVLAFTGVLGDSIEKAIKMLIEKFVRYMRW